MNKFKKSISLLLAFLLTLSVVSPAFAAGEKTNTVVVHKILATDGNLQSVQNFLNSDQSYNGKQVDQLPSNATEIAGVFFAVQNAQGQYIDATGKVVASADLALSGLTTATGLSLDTSNLPQDVQTQYKIVELHDKSSYAGANNEQLASSLAVPVEITLPLANAEGIVDEAHVYPKNTQKTPDVTKQITTQPSSLKVGDVLGYTITTTVPQDAQYRTLKFSDAMTKGLDLVHDETDNDYNFEVDGIALTAGTDYVVVKDSKGFTLTFTTAGLEKVRTQAATQSFDITIKYNVRINADAEVVNKDNNVVGLDFGNTPNVDDEKSPQVTPQTQQIDVEKTFSGTTPNNVEITYELYEVTASGAEVLVETSPVKRGTSNSEYNHTFNGLDDSKSYVVKERVAGFQATYTVDQNIVRITNTPDTVTPQNQEITVNKKWNGGDTVPTPNPLIKYALYVVNNNQEILVEEVSKTGPNYSHTFTGLDNNKKYVVKEVENAGFTPSYTRNQGNVEINNTQPTTTPQNQEIKVEKTWNGTTNVPNPAVRVVYSLYKVESGVETLVESVSKEGTTAEDYNHTFTGLDNSATYVVKERVSGYKPSYDTNTTGTVKIDNKGTTPTIKIINSSKISIPLGSKKFVKTNDKALDNAALDRLDGAEFYVGRMDQGAKQYLKIKDTQEVQALKQAYEAAEQEYQSKVDRANQLLASQPQDENQPGTELNTLLKGDAQTQGSLAYYEALRNEAFRKARIGYDYTTDKNEALVLTSNIDGQFEITGLGYGTYFLEEKAAPTGYAKLAEDISFEISDTSHESEADETGIPFDPQADQSTAQKDARRVINKNITIPQTGGIGTTLFIIVGIAMMAGAAYLVMKNNKAEA